MTSSIDVLVLGGGYGTRLFDKLKLPNYTPKGLIQINGICGLDRGLETFSKNLIGKVIIETNSEGVSAYSKWVRNNLIYDAEIFVEPFSRPDLCWGILDTLRYVYKKLKFKEPILLMAPDNIFSQNQDQLILDANSADGKILTYKVKRLIDAKKYGVIQTFGNKIIGCEEKPRLPKSRTIKTAYEIWKPRMFEELKEWARIGNSDKVGDYINYLISKDFGILSIPTKGEWIDIGTKSDLEKTRRFFK